MEYSSLSPEIAFYGAIARANVVQPHQATLKRRLLRKIIKLRDRLFWRFGIIDCIDYRNYENFYPSNVGDLAVSEVARALFGDVSNNRQSVINLNWGELGCIESLHDSLKIIVVSGGGYILFDREGALPERIKYDIGALDKSRIPVVLFGIGVNFPGETWFDPLSFVVSKNDEDSLRYLLERAASISVRDIPSLRFLSRFTRKNIHLIGDPALCLLSAAPEPSHVPSQSQPLVGINFSFHGPGSTEILKRNIESYVRILKALSIASCCRFRYFVHNDTEHLIPRLFATRGIEMEVVSGAPDNVAKAYRGLDLHIGGMLHSCILAHGAGVPCLGLAYDIKHYGFFSLFGLEQNYFSAIDFDENKFIERVLTILADPTPTRAIISARTSELRAATKEFVASCLELCSTGTVDQHDQTY